MIMAAASIASSEAATAATLPTTGSASVPAGAASASGNYQSVAATAALAASLQTMAATTAEMAQVCDGLTRRARQLDSLTSPASETSSTLAQAASHLGATLNLMTEANEKFSTVQDCEPAIQRLSQGQVRAELSEQDVYAAVDSMEIIRDSYSYFLQRREWRSTPSAIGGLERSHQLGVDAMCHLVRRHLNGAGEAVRAKRGVKEGKSGSGKKGAQLRMSGTVVVPPRNESAAESRARLSAALQNRDLMKSVGEYQEHLPLESRSVRELRAVLECLAEGGAYLGLDSAELALRQRRPRSSSSKVVRTEKVGSGGYCNLVNQPLKTGYPQLDAYGEARKVVARQSLDSYYRQVKAERRKDIQRQRSSQGSGGGATEVDSIAEIDEAARDGVRCLEHAMVVVAGEKSVYRCLVSPHSNDKSGRPVVLTPEYRDGLIMAYSYVAAAVVDRSMDIIENVFLKDCRTGSPPGKPKDGEAATDHSSGATVRSYGSAAAAGLRILDGVRMLGPSLAKLCDMEKDKMIGSTRDGRPSGSGESSPSSIASNLCVAIHRTTVKNTARTLENLAKAIHVDPLDGDKHRPRDARIATVSSDVVRAIRLTSPFMSAYKSVTKRRALPWDPKMGDDSNDINSFVRFIILRLLNNLQGKALNYAQDPGADASAKSSLFMINNTQYLLDQLAATPNNKKIQFADGEIDGDKYRIEAPWFREKVGKIFEAEKANYVGHWDAVNHHLTSVDKAELTYQGGSDKLLSLESGRLIKSRFAGFIEDFEKLYAVHQPLAVVDPKLRTMLQRDVVNAFVPRYTRFFEKYSRYQFSKKNMDEYLKYPPGRIEKMLSALFESQ